MQRARLFRVGKAGIERGRDGAACHHGLIGQVELSPSLGLQGYHVALIHAGGAQAYRDLPDGPGILAPGPGTILAASGGLLERDSVGICRCSGFEYPPNGFHPHNPIMPHPGKSA